MNIFRLAMVVLLALSGCDETIVATGCGDIDVSSGEQAFVPPPVQDDECVPREVTHTRVPSTRLNGHDLVLICTECDVEECNALGARCSVEGTACDFHGKLGICTGCCDSEFGELHCAQVPN